MARQKNNICLSCSKTFRSRKGARTCSDRCRKRLQRANAMRSPQVFLTGQSPKGVIASIENKVEQVAKEVERAAETVAKKVEPEYATEGGFLGGGDKGADTATLEDPSTSQVVVDHNSTQIITPQAIKAEVEPAPELVPDPVPVKSMPGLTQPGQPMVDVIQPAAAPATLPVEQTLPAAAPLQQDMMQGVFNQSLTEEDDTSHSYNPFAMGGWREAGGWLLRAAIIRLVGGVVPFFLWPKNHGPATNASVTQSVSSPQISGTLLKLNINALVAGGKTLVATGPVNFQNQS